MWSSIAVSDFCDHCAGEEGARGYLFYHRKIFCGGPLSYITDLNKFIIIQSFQERDIAQKWYIIVLENKAKSI